jgi:hypothetical protein
MNSFVQMMMRVTVSGGNIAERTDDTVVYVTRWKFWVYGAYSVDLKLRLVAGRQHVVVKGSTQLLGVKTAYFEKEAWWSQYGIDFDKDCRYSSSKGMTC